MQDKIPPYLQMLSEFDAWVEQHYPKGKMLRWTWGKYKGRTALVSRATWAVEDETFKVLVTVETMRADGLGVIGSSNMFHRIFREVDDYFTPSP